MNNGSEIIDAFFACCKNAILTKDKHYVVLYQQISGYGGPEEGGWWWHDSIVVAYEECATREEAEIKSAEIAKMAKELNKEEIEQYGKYCQSTVDWLDSQGLDADYLPEVDGHSEFYVVITSQLPQNHYGNRYYE